MILPYNVVVQATREQRLALFGHLHLMRHVEESAGSHSLSPPNEPRCPARMMGSKVILVPSLCWSPSNPVSPCLLSTPHP